MENPFISSLTSSSNNKYPVAKTGTYKCYLFDVEFKKDVKQTYKDEVKSVNQLRFKFDTVTEVPSTNECDGVARCTAFFTASLNPKAHLPSFLRQVAGAEFVNVQTDMEKVWALLQDLKGRLFHVVMEPNKDGRFNRFISANPILADDGSPARHVDGRDDIVYESEEQSKDSEGFSSMPDADDDDIPW